MKNSPEFWQILTGKSISESRDCLIQTSIARVYGNPIRLVTSTGCTFSQTNNLQGEMFIN